MKKAITLGLLFLLVFSLQAQDEELLDSLSYEEEPSEEVFIRAFSLDGHFIMGFAQGRFQENMDALAAGAGIRILVDSKKTGSSIWGGVELDWMSYGSERTEILVSNGAFDERYDLEINNSIFSMNGVLRVIPQWDKRILPYADGLFGFKSLYTSSKLYEERFDGNLQIDRETNERDYALQYGGAIGILIRRNWLGRIRTYIDLKVQYLRGSTASYLVRVDDPDSFEDPLDAYELRTSRTDIFIPQVGFVIEFQ